MIAGIAAIAAPIVGGLLGNVMSQGDRSKARGSMKEAVEALKDVGVAPDLAKEIIYQQFQQVGILTPELEEDLNLATSEIAQIQEDPAMREIQMSAIEKFRQQAAGGLGPEERAAINQIQREVGRESEAKRQQIMSDMRRRGIQGGGAELAAQLQGTQGAAEIAAQQGDQISAMLADRIRQGTQQMFQAGGSMREQDYQRQLQRAQALDERNKFLYENSASRQARNVASKNLARQQNLEEQQRIADANTQMANEEKLRQVAEQGRRWDRNLQRGSALADAYSGQASNYAKQAQQTAQSYSDMGKGVGEGALGYKKYTDSNALEWAKLGKKPPG